MAKIFTGNTNFMRVGARIRSPEGKNSIITSIDSDTTITVKHLGFFRNWWLERPFKKMIPTFFMLYFYICILVNIPELNLLWILIYTVIFGICGSWLSDNFVNTIKWVD